MMRQKQLQNPNSTLACCSTVYSSKQLQSQVNKNTARKTFGPTK